MPIFKTSDIKINYLQLPCEKGDGDSEQEDLVMIHGLATNMAFWYLNIAPKLTKRFRVTLYDLRGHGRTTMTESGYRPEDMAQDLKQLLGHLNINKAHFVAHSFGAVVALRFAVENSHRVSSLVLADTHIAEVRHMREGGEWKYSAAIQQVLEENNLNLRADDPYFGYRLLKAIARKQISNEKITDDLTDIINPLMSKAGKRTASQWLKLLETTQAETELMGDDGLKREQLEKIYFPILALYGERSQAMTTGEKLLTVWPHARFCQIKGEGHFFPVIKHEEVVRECEAFWNRQRVNPVVLRDSDQQQKNFFRSDRFDRVGRDWFFATREGLIQGPFSKLCEAERRLAEYVHECRVRIN